MRNNYFFIIAIFLLNIKYFEIEDYRGPKVSPNIEKIWKIKRIFEIEYIKVCIYF